jgi:hypothetical protein
VTRVGDRRRVEPTRGPITFILRLTPGGDGLRGVVQRVLTRETSRFDGDERLVEILREAVRREERRAAGSAPDDAGAEPRPADEKP